MSDSHRPDDEPGFESDWEGESKPLVLLWEQDQSDIHPVFRDALDSLATKGCQRYRIVYLLMHVPAAVLAENASKDDIDTTADDLGRGMKALQRLRAKQLLPFLGPLARRHQVVLAWLTQAQVDVKMLAAHAGKSLLMEELTAALVSHVLDATGAPHDRLVSGLLDAAAQSPWKFSDSYEFTRRERQKQSPNNSEAHRKWRGYHADLIQEDTALRQRWFREADAEGKYVADWQKRSLASPDRQLEAHQLLAQGSSRQAIADQLGTTVQAVDSWLAEAGGEPARGPAARSDEDA
jgi:hypothetical protein